MLRRICLKMDKLHFVLVAACMVLGTVLFNGYSQQSNVEFNVYESARHVHSSSSSSNSTANKKELVYYDSTVPLLWIGGVPRSGTTLMRAMLDAHPEIRCGEETRVIPRILGMHSKTITSEMEMSRLNEAHISEGLLRDAMASYILTIIAGHGESAPLLCNKDPFAIRSMTHIRRMFPNSKFIMMIRDGRAVSHSIITRHVTIKGFDMKSYEGSMKDWNRAIATMWESCRASGPSICLPVYYERLVLEPKPQMERILKFLGISWDDMVIHHEQAVGVKGGISLSKKEPSTDQVNKAVNLQALSKWYGVIQPSALRILDQQVPMLKRLGYDTHQYPPDYSRLLDPKAERTLNL